MFAFLPIILDFKSCYGYSDLIICRYLEKVIEFLCLVASQHFFRYDAHTSKQFVTHLLTFTFEQEESAYYYECLEIWARLLDHLNAGVPFVNITINREDLIEYFKQPMLDLATKIVLSTQKFDAESDSTFETDVSLKFGVASIIFAEEVLTGIINLCRKKKRKLKHLVFQETSTSL